MDACISWKIMQTPIGSKVQTQLHRDRNFLDGSELVELVSKEGWLNGRNWWYSSEKI